MIAVILLVAPQTVFAMDPAGFMDPISDNELDDVSCQAGLSVYQQGKPSLTFSFSSLSWGDNDGILDHGGAGYLIFDGLDTSLNVMPAEFLIAMKDAIITIDEFTAQSNMDFDNSGGPPWDMASGKTGVRIGMPYILWNSNLPNVIRCSMNGTGTYSAGDELIELRLANFVMDLSSSPTAMFMWPH